MPSAAVFRRAAGFPSARRADSYGPARILRERFFEQSGVFGPHEAVGHLDAATSNAPRLARHRSRYRRRLLRGRKERSLCGWRLADVAPALVARLVHAALEGDYEQARAMHHQLLPLIDDLFSLSNPIPVKKALALLGFGNADVRLPLSPPDAALSSRLAERLRTLELL